jgi:hypothetical protein
MFTLSVGHLLESYTGDSETLDFSGDVLPATFADIETLSPLSFRLTMISLDDGLETIVEDLDVKVRYEGNVHSVAIPRFERTFKMEADPLAPDDVKLVNKKHSTIDFGEVLREEIIMACC